MKSKRKFGGIIVIGIGFVFLIWGTVILMGREDLDLSASSGFRSIIVVIVGSFLIIMGIIRSIFEFKWNNALKGK